MDPGTKRKSHYWHISEVATGAALLPSLEPSCCWKLAVAEVGRPAHDVAVMPTRTCASRREGKWQQTCRMLVFY